MCYLKSLGLTLLLMVTISTLSSARGATLSAKSETGKVQLTVKLADLDGPIVSAQLTTEQGAVDLSADYDAYSVIDVPNHIITICFQEKGKPAGTPDAKIIKAWAIPSSFVKLTTGEFDWRFKIKTGGNMLKEVTTLNATFESDK
ncbi:MAG: hypothetical protein JST90_07885 [Bacteroidetes bacterium]|nr:hypothetical protein [Bacteroidota bacterium]